MFTRTKFQEGCLTKEKRQRQPDVWVYRWRELAQDGSVKRRKVIVGTVDQYRTESLAKKALAALNLNVNQHQSEGAHPALMTMGQLITHYKVEELSETRPSKALSTVDVYTDFLDLYILPKWANVRAASIKPNEVEVWLRSLKFANGTKAKIRNIMSAVFQHGLRFQLVTANPIRGLVRQGAKRRKDPDVLTAQEMKAILEKLIPSHRAMILVASTVGLRVSELRGLQWQDVDSESGLLNLRRGVVNRHISEMKNAGSRKPVPLHPLVVETLDSLKVSSAYNKPSDWIFASRKKEGKVPVWPSSLMADHIQPAARAANVAKHVSFHVFRHSLGTLLKANGEDVKTVQESLRHANSRTTLDLYTQAIPTAVRSAHSKIVEQIAADGDFQPIGPRLDPCSIEMTVSC
jgi:integrase